MTDKQMFAAHMRRWLSAEGCRKLTYAELFGRVETAQIFGVITSREFMAIVAWMNRNPNKHSLHRWTEVRK